MANRFLNNIDVNGNVKITETAATSDTDKFVVLDSGVLKYRTGTEVLSDIGAQVSLTNPVTGTGTTNYLSKFTGTTSLGDSLIYDNGTNVGIGTTSPSSLLHLQSTGKAWLTIEADTDNITETDTALIVFKQDGSVVNGRVGFSSTNHFEIYNEYGGGDVSLGANNGERLRLLANGNSYFTGGNVGIGTTSPINLLTIKSNALGSTPFGTLASDGSYLAYIKEASAGHGELYVANTSGVARVLLNGNGDSYFTGGNVGIGTTSPASKLHVNGNVTIGDIGTTAPQEPLMVKTKTDAYFPGIKLENYNSEVGLYIQNIDGYNTGIGTGRYYNSGFWRSDLTSPTSVRFDQGVIRFYAQSGVTVDTNYTATERMRITSDGNVGIGTTSPSAQLHLSNASDAVFKMTSGTSDFTFLMDGNMRMFNGVGEVVRITSAGNVGIGTTSPSAKLDVQGSQLLNGSLYLGNTLTRISSDGTGEVGLNYGSSATSTYALSVYNSTTRTVGLRKDGGAYFVGNVGIGTTSPTQKLHVAGNGLFSGTVAASNLSGTNTGDLSSTKRVDLTSTVQTADYRRSVIALCEVTNTDVSLNSYSSGTIVTHRANALSNNTEQTLICSFAKNYNSTVARYKMLKLGVAATNIRACTFTYNGVKYAGVELYLQAARSSKIEFNGATNFNIFGLDYYDTQNNLPLNTEVNNSLNFTENIADDALYYNEKTIYHAGNFLAGTHYQTPKTTLSGYGITDAYTKTQIDSGLNIAYKNQDNNFSVGQTITGIGNTAGTNSLVLKNNTGNITFSFRDSGDFILAQPSKIVFANGQYIRDNGSAGLTISTVNSTADIHLKTNDVTRLTVDQDGKVGIGTTSPYGKLHVLDSAAGAAGMTVHNNTEASGNSAAVWFKVAGSTADYRKGAILFVNDGSGYGRGDFYFSSNYSTASSSIASNSDAKVVIKGSTGNVGIGTTSPVSPLDVNGVISSKGIHIAQNSGAYNVLYNASNSVGIYLGGSADQGNYYDNTTHYFRSSGGSTTYAVINYLGNVGIGTTSPNNFGFLETALNVSAGSSSSTTLQQAGLVISGSSDADDADDFGYLSFTNHQATISNGRVAEVRVVKNGTDVNTGEFAFYTSSGSGAAERMRIAYNGNVGIGTTSPVTKLDVSGNVTLLDKLLINGADFDSASVESTSGRVIARVDTQDNIFDYGDQAMYISSGNVGIGTTSPLVRFVNSGAVLSDNATLGSGTVGSQAILSANGFYGLYTGVSGAGYVWEQVQRNDANTSVYSRILQPRGGNVGIGITSPTEKLHVAGNGLFSGSITANGAQINNVDLVVSGAKVNSQGGYATSSTGGYSIDGKSNADVLLAGGGTTPLSSISGSTPVTTKGDIYTYSTSPTRLPVGSDGKVLMANSNNATGLEWNDPDWGVVYCDEYALSDEETDLTTGKKLTFRLPFAITPTAVRISVGTAPVGSTLIVDINKNGVSMLTTKLSIDAGEKTSTTASSQAVINTFNWEDDQEITVDVDQIGSSVAGAGLKLKLYYKKGSTGAP